MACLLHIDTSTDTGCVAIAKDGVLMAFLENTESRNHAATINTMIDDLMAREGLSFADLSAVVVCAGPGSYTGLRIGMATAKGICYAVQSSLLLQDRLTLLAYRDFRRYGTARSQYIAILAAREDEYFVAVYNSVFQCILSPRHVTAEELPLLINNIDMSHFITDSIDKIKTEHFSGFYAENDIKIDLDQWVSYAFQNYLSNNIADLHHAEPFYLKQVYTHKPLNIN